jgi:hypothetical protein
VQTLSGQDDMSDNVDVSPAIAQEMVVLVRAVRALHRFEIPDGLKDADNN